MKKNKIMYWSFTGLIAASFLMSSVMYLSKNPTMAKATADLGYPLYLMAIMGVAKLLGAIAIINPWSPKLKEWAYAGFTITLIGAIWSHAATNTSFVAPLVFLVLVAVSYYFFNKIKVADNKQSVLAI